MKILIKLFVAVILFNCYVFPQWTNDPGLNTQVSLSYPGGFDDETCKSASDGDGGVIIVWVSSYINAQAIFAQRLDANGYRMWGDDGVVVSDAIGVQYNPVIVSDGMGGAIVAWEDYRSLSGSYHHIYAQRINSNGVLRWPTTNGVAVNTIDSDKHYLQIASDNNHGAYIVWADDRILNPGLYAQRLNENGILFGTPGGIPICTATNIQIDPSIITTQGNDAILSWIDQRSSIDEIYAQKIDFFGNIQWTANGIKVSDNSISFPIDRHSICSDAMGGAILTWPQTSSGSNENIYAQRISSDGITLWTPPLNEPGIIVGNAIDDLINPVITMDGSGGAIVAWGDVNIGNSNTDIYAQRINSSGTSLWANGELIVYPARQIYDDIEIISTNTGGAIICWSDIRDYGTSSEDIYAQAINANGDFLWNSSGNVITNSYAAQKFPSVVSDGLNGAIVVWPDTRGDGPYAQKIKFDGTLPEANALNGIISPGEYGSHVEGENMFTSGNSTWYMNWDYTNLYVAIENYDFNSPVILYMDAHQVQVPVNDNDPQFGNLVGTGDDGVSIQLPFSADFYYYLEPGANSGSGLAYKKVPNGTGGWSVGTIPLNFVYNSTTFTLEFSIPWSDINPNFQVDGGEFNWLGYLASLSTPLGSYSTVPATNIQGVNMIASWYYTVRPAGGLGIPPAFPFANESYTHQGNSLTINQFDCFDFTMNTPNTTIQRSSGVWNIDGNMVIAAGTVNFLNTGDINIKENYVQLDGIVSFSNGFNNADVFVGMNCFFSNGIMTIGTGHNFTLNGFGGSLEGLFPFYNLIIDLIPSPSSTIVLGSDQSVINNLNLVEGKLNTDSLYKITISDGGSVTRTNGYVVGELRKENINGSIDFEVGSNNGYSPVQLYAYNTGSFSVRSHSNPHPIGQGTNRLQMYWTLNNYGLSSADLVFNYNQLEVVGDESDYVVGVFNGSWSFPSFNLDIINNKVYVNGVTAFSDWTLGEQNSITFTDGTISPGEYGSHVEGENMYSSGGKTWFMNYDSDYIYIGITGYTNQQDAIVIYLDVTGVSPPNAGQFGSLTGVNLNGYEPNLPFGADFYAFISPFYDEYRHSDNFGVWGSPTPGSIIKTYNGSAGVFEIAIPLSILPPLNPLSQIFWLGYLINNGSASSHVPKDLNPSGISNDLTWHFNIWLNCPSCLAFSEKCYTHIGPDVTMGAITCYDFFMNTPGATINRTSGIWDIEGRLFLQAGTLTFQNNDTINVTTLFHGGGTLNINLSPLNWFFAIYQYGGTLNIHPDQVSTFSSVGWPYGGNFESITAFPNIVINNPGILKLRSDMTIDKSLTFLQGTIQTIQTTYTPPDTFYVILNAGALLNGNGHVDGALTMYIQNPPGPNGGDSPDNLVINFPVGTANGPSPVSIDFSSVTNGGKLTVAAYQSIQPNSFDSSKTLQRYWKITKDNDLAFTSADITFNYRPEDFNGTTFSEATDEDSMIVGKYDASWSYPSIFTRTPGGINDGGSITISGVTSFSDFTMFKAQLSANIRVFLEGPFSAGSMSTSLNTGGSIPLNQPYNSTPWNYNGTETVGSIPGEVVDWVLLELRSNTTTTVARRAAFLRSNGSLVDLDGTSNVSFPGVQAGDYYLVVYHRNHLPIMTANTVQVSNNPALFDLSTGQGQAYGTNAMKDLGGGVYGLYTADTDGSGTVNATDRSNTWNQRNLSGYYGTDVDLSGTVNAADRSAVWNNRNINTQVPSPVNKPVTEIVKEANN